MHNILCDSAQVPVRVAYQHGAAQGKTLLMSAPRLHKHECLNSCQHKPEMAPKHVAGQPTLCLLIPCLVLSWKGCLQEEVELLTYLQLHSTYTLKLVGQLPFDQDSC